MVFLAQWVVAHPDKPKSLQNLIPHFGTVLALADHASFRQGPLGAAMESVILCVLEIGMLIG